MRRLLLGVLLASGLWGRASGQTPAAPPSDAKATAQALFDEGQRLMAAGQIAEACAKLAASLHLDPAVGTEGALATCDEKLGKIATAWALWVEVIELSQQAGRADRADFARKRADALKPRLPHIKVVVAAEVPGLQVRRDGVVIDPAARGVAMPVDPGKHTIDASAPGRIRWVGDVSVAEKETAVVTIPALAEIPVDPPPGPAPAPVAHPPPVDPAPLPVTIAAPLPPPPPPPRLFAFEPIFEAGIGLNVGHRELGTPGNGLSLRGVASLRIIGPLRALAHIHYSRVSYLGEGLSDFDFGLGGGLIGESFLGLRYYADAGLVGASVDVPTSTGNVTVSGAGFFVRVGAATRLAGRSWLGVDIAYTQVQADYTPAWTAFSLTLLL